MELKPLLSVPIHPSDCTSPLQVIHYCIETYRTHPYVSNMDLAEYIEMLLRESLRNGERIIESGAEHKLAYKRK